jgi:hypothetical protein
MTNPAAPEGGQGDVAAAAAAAAQQAVQGQGQQSGNADKGFPENTPVAEMSAEQRANYYKHYNRQADNKLAAFKGVTPEHVQQMQSRLDELEGAQLSASDKAIKDAQKAAREAADAEWRPKLQAAQLRGIVGQVLKGEELNSWMFGRDPSAFANANGDIDEEKVMGHLTASHGGQNRQNGNGQQPPRQQQVWGQQAGAAGVGVIPAQQPGQAGLAEAQKRFGKKPT